MPTMRLRSHASLLICLLLAAAATAASAQPAPPNSGSNVRGVSILYAGSPNWTGSWFASQQIPEPANALPAPYLHNATLRQLIHLSLAGPTIRVRISNAFGAAPLTLSAVHVARPISPDSSRIDPASDRALSFDGLAQVTIPAGADYTSDPLAYPVAAQSDLAISICIDSAPNQQTGHPGSRSTSYAISGCAPASAEFTTAESAAPQSASSAAGADQTPPAPPSSSPHFDHWYYLTAVDVIAPPSASAVVILGDSITDGHGATTNGNDRWTDDLARRLLQSAPGHPVAVLNAGLGGNRILNDGLGPNALARLDRDVLAPPGVRALIVHEGVNDLGTFSRSVDATLTEQAQLALHAALVARLIGAYSQIVSRAHAHGIRVIGTTILPFTGNAGYHPGALTESDRQAINAWIRESGPRAPGHFDAVVDFDRALADPANPTQLRPDYDRGDHLHPSVAGYHAMADAVPLALLQ